MNRSNDPHKITTHITTDTYTYINNHKTHSLCDRQRAVVLTIHQPSIEIYSLFDRLTLLSQGRMAYHGPADGTYECIHIHVFVCMCLGMGDITKPNTHNNTNTKPGILPYLASPPLLLAPSTTIDNEQQQQQQQVNPADFALRVASCAFSPVPDSSSSNCTGGGGGMRRLASSSSLVLTPSSRSNSAQNLRRLGSSSKLVAVGEGAAVGVITPEALAAAYAGSAVARAVDVRRCRWI